jgi:DNA-directed RNA polymerase subunit omega
VLLASHRAKVLNAGNEAQVPLDNDKSTVIALREIADEKISVNDVKEDIIKSYQLVQEKEEENEDHLLED